MNVYSSIIHNRQEVKKVQMSLHTFYMDLLIQLNLNVSFSSISHLSWNISNNQHFVFSR